MKRTGVEKVSREQGDVNGTPRRQSYIDKHVVGRAKELYTRDKKVFMHQSLSTPVLNVLSREEGAYIYDMDGNRYLDCHGNGVHAAGFNNDYVIEKVRDALASKHTFSSRRYTNEHIVKLAEKLVEITPEGLDKVSFCPGGSEAIEMAVSLAKSVTGKWKTISFWDSYHGTGFQAASLGGERLFKKGLGPMVPGAFHVEFPNYNHNPWGFKSPKQVDDEILRQMKLIFEKEGDVACVVGEPISATPNMPTTYFWERVKALCTEYGALLIFDEVIEGFGRTGKMFASEYFITPDILVLGKSLGGGLIPFAGIVTKSAYDVLSKQSSGHYTHEKNGLCGVAGLAVIEYLEGHNLIANAKIMGERLISSFREMASKYGFIGSIDGVGLHIGIEILCKDGSGEKGTEEAEEIMYKCMERGLAFKIIESNIITLRPSLVINQDDVVFIVETIEAAVNEVNLSIIGYKRIR